MGDLHSPHQPPDLHGLDDRALLGGFVRQRAGISSGDRIPTDAQDLHAHLESVFDGIEFRALVVRPHHRHLSDLETTPACEIYQLRIESPTLDQLTREDGISSACRESFEAALSVFFFDSEKNSQQKIE